jgi:hypothetical protein
VPPPSVRSRRDPAATRQGWVDRLARYRSSGQTVAQFCAAEGVSIPSFYVWKRTLTAAPAASGGGPTLVPIRLTPSPIAAAIELVFPSGAVLRFPGDTPAGRIADIVSAVEGRAC